MDRFVFLISLFLMIIFAFPAISSAQGAGTAPPRPCAEDPLFAQFDFWLGEWEVTANGQLAGHNRITRREHGCVLFESWTGARGSTGISMNYYDRNAGEWVQLWHSAAGALIEIRGGLVNGSMVLTGTLQNVADGSEAPFRGTWTPLEDGRVRQFFEQYSPEEKAWQPWFEGFYARTDAE